MAAHGTVLAWSAPRPSSAPISVKAEPRHRYSELAIALAGVWRGWTGVHRCGRHLRPRAHAISIIRKELVMLIPTDTWAALLESGVTVRPTGPAEVELVAAEGNAMAVTAVGEPRPSALSPSHVRSHLLHASPTRGELRSAVPSASPAALDAA